MRMYHQGYVRQICVYVTEYSYSLHLFTNLSYHTVDCRLSSTNVYNYKCVNRLVLYYVLRVDSTISAYFLS